MLLINAFFFCFLLVTFTFLPKKLSLLWYFYEKTNPNFKSTQDIRANKT